MTASTPRFSMKKRFIAPVAVMATIPAALALALPAQAASGADPVFGEWAFTHYTELQTDPNAPADPDNESGKNNPDNVIRIGDLHAEWVSGTSKTEYTDWVTEKPAGEGWVQIDHRSVVDHTADEVIPATTDTPQQRYSWNPHGPQDETDGPGPGSTPLTDPDHWQANTSHYNGTDPLGQAFQEGHGNGGNNASWFYWSYAPGTEQHTVHHDVTSDLYLYKLVTETQGHTEYSWAVYERTVSPGDSDPTDPGTPADPSDPGTPSEPTQPSTPPVPTEVKGQTAQTTSSHPSKPSQPTQTQATGHNAPAVPLSIDAGL